MWRNVSVLRCGSGGGDNGASYSGVPDNDGAAGHISAFQSYAQISLPPQKLPCASHLSTTHAKMSEKGKKKDRSTSENKAKQLEKGGKSSKKSKTGTSKKQVSSTGALSLLADGLAVDSTLSSLFAVKVRLSSSHTKNEC